MKPIIALRIVGAVALASLIAWSNPAPAAEYHDTRTDNIVVSRPNYTPEQWKAINHLLAENQAIRDGKAERDAKAVAWRVANRDLGEQAYCGTIGRIVGCE